MLISNDAFFIPDPNIIKGDTVVLSKSISAIQLVGKEAGRAKLGLLSQLGPGTTVRRCGDGFDERTAKVFADGQFYFVFLQDLKAETFQAAN